MMYSNIPSAQTLVLYLKSKGIKNIVISPGSRNAPLTLSFTKNPFFNCYSIVDERCAGFFAMGMAQQLREPVVVVCTSGSALLNYYPAVAEAFYSDIPLLVISADRPKYKIDVGDGQTIRQENIFENHIGYEANLKQDVTHSQSAISELDPRYLDESQGKIQNYNEKEIAQALSVLANQRAPVHINIPFEEPLYDMVDEPSVSVQEITYTKKAEEVAVNWDELKKIWNSSSRKMVLVGVNYPEAVNSENLEKLASDKNVLVFTETTSNIHHPDFFPSIDSIVAPIEKSEKRDELFNQLQPDVLVTFGGLIVSKKIKAFLRKYKPKTHWHIDNKKAYDTFFCLSDHIKIEPDTFFSKILDSETVNGDYQENWNGVRKEYERKREEYLSKIPFSDFKVFSRVQRSIREGYQVHLANSSTVRYAQLFPMNASLEVYCNRGTSGIDGSTSTAMGASIFFDRPTLLITGDLSFFYDSNALWNNYTRPDFRIILINNSGGGIFRILPGKEETEEFSNFFETKHRLTAEHLARMHQFQYIKAQDENQLISCLKEFYEPSGQPIILEICTPRSVNDKVLLDYFDFIS
ncbi:2-succinyl-5-enolpyruvyl-6-hydroxy-3-cyclohexene-1-carboxylic-acid synthase [Flagellimonas onchidii]|uniref:2-succinyl-5-enolpyruvyl-6-hydroxy-3- cyclohexene-1-carboxylic-acid synthase n=1 Tax=Flagellimonas onchidii TaxID=2562684 RepID=UPI0010A5B477|nr:2-succinyl-5-enolpyruvyl-6-hydroxy-3-cyclohexene-1-carboxylic-acid synthase [Allomuricauda onchidii]